MKYVIEIHELIITFIKIWGLSSQNLYLVNNFFLKITSFGINPIFYGEEGSVTPAHPSVHV
jgi:hypothetical protein